MAHSSSLSSPATAAVSSHSVWRLAWPIILSNLSVPLLGLIGTAVVGHLPEARYLGAVTLGTMLFSLLFWAFGFLRMGTTGLTSQAHGRADHAVVRALLLQSLALAAAIGAMLILLSPWLVPFALGLLGGAPEVQALATEYARIRIFSAPAVLANYVVIGWFLGQQNARATLILMLVGNLLNIALTFGLVLGAGLNSNGVAWAALVADYATLALAVWLVQARGRALGGNFNLSALRGLAGYAALFQVNRHLFVRTLCLLFASAFFTARGAAEGTTVLAANAVLMQFVMLTAFALDGFAQAAEALTGRAIGERRFDQFGVAVRACARFSLFTAVGAALLFALAGPWMIDLLTGIEEVRAAARDYLPWLVLMPLIAVWSYLLDGVFIGATETKAMRDTLLLSLAIYLPSWYLLQGFGNHGLWLAFSLFTLTRSVSLGAIYLRRRKGAWRGSV